MILHLHSKVLWSEIIQTVTFCVWELSLVNGDFLWLSRVVRLSVLPPDTPFIFRSFSAVAKLWAAFSLKALAWLQENAWRLSVNSSNITVSSVGILWCLSVRVSVLVHNYWKYQWLTRLTRSSWSVIRFTRDGFESHVMLALGDGGHQHQTLLVFLSCLLIGCCPQGAKSHWGFRGSSQRSQKKAWLNECQAGRAPTVQSHSAFDLHTSAERSTFISH